MAYEQRDNSGSLFRNERKDKDSHPDYTGNGMIDGKGYWFSAWIKKDRNGKSFMSMSFKPKEEQREQAPQKSYPPDRITTGRMPTKQSILPDEDGEIPF
jgi:hypothetical protein